MIHIQTTTERLENIGGLLIASQIGHAIGLTKLSCSRLTN
jgi:hypothetical protein